MEALIDNNEDVPQTAQESRDPPRTRKRPLEPMDRLSEIWFGLMMVLTFTCSLSVKQAGHQEVREMLIGAIGCNVAWGIIDGFMYILASFIERGHLIFALQAVRAANSPAVAHRIIAKAMPSSVASTLTPEEFEKVRHKLNELPEPPAHPRLNKDDWLGGFAVFVAVLLSTFPVVIPFLLTSNALLALRISNGVAIAMLFLIGYAFGRHAGYRPWRLGLWMAVVGSVLVTITVELGG